ncbi:CDGSH iron-sulfur domain-containing protein 1-like [Physella acuta]|uniref:CDGSH iron-sulfur domain-containing protein 1-like n=1 Tax=Physella acuta TaxID=109671 RepID=UPI0027DBF4E3|nr:CDGSH iron-sulfur domain-containing protein 1-like [Physella acuta]
MGLEIGGRDVSYIPVITTIALGLYVAWQCFRSSNKPPSKINPGIDKSKDKVVTSVNVEDVGDNACYCRCWRSKKFPMCDGSHNAYNQETGDNVGPLCFKKEKCSS